MYRISNLIFCVLLICSLFSNPIAHAQEVDTSFHETVRLGRGSISKVAWSPNGEMLAVAGQYSIWIYSDNLEDVTRLDGHTDWIETIDWNHDGTQLASGGRDNTIRIWDIESGESLFVLEDEINEVSKVVWNPQADLIASGDRSGFIRIWNPKTGEELSSFDAHTVGASGFSAVTGLDWSPDGLQLASTGYDGILHFWDAQTFELLDSFEIGVVRSLDWKPDGTALVMARDSSIILWSTITEDIDGTVNIEHGSVLLAVWSPDGSQIAVLDFRAINDLQETDLEYGRIWLWDLVSQESRIISENEKYMRSVTWHPNDRRLVTGTAYYDNVLKVWNPDTGELLNSLETHNDDVRSIAWSPDSQWLASGHEDGNILIWDTTTERQAIAVLKGHTGRQGEPRRIWAAVNSLAWKPDGTQLTSASRSRVLIWDFQTFEVLHELEGAAEVVAWKPDGTQLATSSRDERMGTIIWDTTSWETISILGTYSPSATAWSPDGTMLATNGSIYEAATLEVLFEPSDDMKYRLDGLDLTWSPGGTQIITSGSTVYFREVYLWNVLTGEHTAILTDETNVTWHPNGHLLAGLGSGLVIWDASSLEPLSTLPSGSLYALEWSPSGRFLASGDSRYWIQIYELH